MQVKETGVTVAAPRSRLSPVRMARGSVSRTTRCWRRRHQFGAGQGPSRATTCLVGKALNAMSRGSVDSEAHLQAELASRLSHRGEILSVIHNGFS